VCQITNGKLSPSDEPTEAYLPFDTKANGYVPGEGGAIVVLETANSARERGIRGYGEIAGYGATFDPPPDAARAPNLAQAIRRALDDAGMAARDIDVVFADGAAVPELDRQEAHAIASVFGAWAVPVTVPKSMTGRLYSGGGALDVAAALLSMRDSVIPPTVGVSEVPASYRIDLVLGEPRELRVRSALVLARGAGGFNAAIVLRSTARD
jgi:minimal PKS chain-length factor (CLF/KS beta)